MDILTKTDPVFESSNNCPGCGSILGLKFILQSVENLRNTVIITSPGSAALMGKAGLKVDFINSRNPVATARGLAAARPDLNIIVYSGDGFTNLNLPSILSARENILYVCYNNLGYANMDIRTGTKEFARIVTNAVYTATASVSYYEDFVAKLKKAFSKTGFKFIDLLAPCPVLWNYDTSNTVEIGRMATESLFWPLYEVDGTLSVTKIPPKIEPVQGYISAVKLSMHNEEVQALQDFVNKRWKSLNEGKMVLAAR